ncbi:MAG: acyl carrier protein [Christensenellaceae bacterium]|nr:acyl carrier protein [Christensenellaceae bacterium]
MVLEKVKEMLAERLDLSVDEITVESKFTDLGLDSLDMAEMLMNAEAEFGVTLEADASMDTVGALVARIESLK